MIYLMFGFALALSTVAAFYAIFGLVAIFAAAPIAIAILGSLLEGSKLVVASWLYRNWKQIPFLLKSYLLVALIVLMFLTSMGIFGFLSRAHIEQTAVGTENQARIEQIEKEISRQNALIERADIKFKQLQTTGIGADSNIQSQINVEQQRIDTAFERIKPAIAEQQRIIDNQIKIYENELEQIDQQLKSLQDHLNAGDVKKAQSVVGVKSDGQFGPATTAAIKDWQTRKQQERRDLINKIENANTNANVKAARNEIQRLRAEVEKQTAESNKLINKLRSQLGTTNTADVEAALNEQQAIIKESTAEVDKLTQQKYELEASVRKLEVEVGPIKYIAEMIYGDQTDANTLEKAVRIMIIMLVSVFDPLAVVMLIAANWTLLNTRKQEPAVSSSDDQKDPTYVTPPAETSEVFEDTVEVADDTPEVVIDHPQPTDTTEPKSESAPRRRSSIFVSDGRTWVSRPRNEK